jgi:hypothetical protein
MNVLTKDSVSQLEQRGSAVDALDVRSLAR